MGKSLLTEPVLHGSRDRQHLMRNQGAGMSRINERCRVCVPVMTGRLLRSVACRELGRWLETERQRGYYNRNNARWRSFLLGNISSMLSSDSYAVSGPLRRGVKRLMKDGGGSTGKVHAQGRLCRFSWYQQSQSRQTTTGRLGRAARSCETCAQTTRQCAHSR